MRLVYWMIGSAALPCAITAGALDTNGVINGWLKAQADLETWEADFTQTRTLRTLKQPLVSAGHVWFAMPNQFRWELGNPAQTIAVRDDQQMLVIYPRLKRAERYPLAGTDAGMLGEALALLDAGFPRDRQTFEERFRIKTLAQTNSVYLLGLEPARASARRMIPLIQLTLATNDLALLANEIVLPDGSRMRNDFTNARLNVTFEANRFTPELGAEYKVTEPLKR